MRFIELEHLGKRYRADYSVDDGVFTVFGDTGHQSTQTGGMTEEQTARLLLRGLIRVGSAKPVDNTKAE
ncbi:MAG: hypothetical protein Q8N13_09210 [Acidovorax sp.]|nr:hypothetical protein [Acidovorax sp.]